MVANDLPLYRYVSFDRFNQMLFSKELAFLSPFTWPDTYELYWLKLLNTEEGRSRLEAYAKQFKGNTQNNADSIIKMCNYQYNNTFCLCFSKAKDSEVFWNARSDQNRCIMFATTRQKLYELLLSKEPNCAIEAVQYDLESSDFDELLKQFYVEPGFTSLVDAERLFLHKRKCFSYEEEVRLIIKPQKIPENSKVFKHPIPCFSDFIDSVMVHPLASDEYVSLIELLCMHFNIPFQGRSEVYSFKLL